MRPHQLTPEELRVRDLKMLGLYNNGLVASKIAERFGISRAAVFKALKRARAYK